MLNQYYKFTVDLLINYLNNYGVQSGDKYYLLVDSENEVDNFMNAISTHSSAATFEYVTEDGSVYTTSKITVDKKSVIIANDSKGIDPDFLVTLRNLVSEQLNEFEETVLLSIVSKPLDSIAGGSKDLQSEGMPLHYEYIKEMLEQEIDHNELKAKDKIFLRKSLEGLINDDLYMEITYRDFSTIFQSLENKSINTETMFELGFFDDGDIVTFDLRNRETRLEKNIELFDFIKKVHELGNGKEELEKKFTDKMVRKLLEEDWYKMSFSEVYKDHQDYEEQKKDVKLEFQNITTSMEGIEIWERPQNDSRPGRRKRHILIFNPEGKPEVHFNVSFFTSIHIKRLTEKALKFVNSIGEEETDVRYLKDSLDFNVRINTDFLFIQSKYTHDNKSSQSCELFISIITSESRNFEDLKTKYLVRPRNKIIELPYRNKIIVGNGDFEETINIETNKQNIELDSSTKKELIVQDVFDEEGNLYFNIIDNTKKVSFMMTTDEHHTLPIMGYEIRNNIRKKERDMVWKKSIDVLIFGTKEYYLRKEYKEFFKWEYEIVESDICYAYYETETLIEKDLNISVEIRKCYSRLINYYKSKNNTIPSLTFPDAKYTEIALEFINQYIKEIEAFKDDDIPGESGLDLLKLGTIEDKETIYFTPLHPLMVAYRLFYFEILGPEDIDRNILERLSPEGLLPYIECKNRQVYKPEFNKNIPEWMVYKPINKVTVNNSNKYLKKLVQDKLNQFTKHFSYMFLANTTAPLKLNVINIVNDRELVRGIIDWTIQKMKKNIHSAPNIEIIKYGTNFEESSFLRFIESQSSSEVEDYFDINLTVRDLDKEEVLKILQTKIVVYMVGKNENVKYAHISFYKLEEQSSMSTRKMDTMDTGISLDGLYSSVPSIREGKVYRTGFGVKNYHMKNTNYLLKLSYYINELVANTRGGGQDSYRQGIGLYSTTTNKDEDKLQEVLNESYWVTLVDPVVDLNYFNNNEELIVIHYSDQYSSSYGYDAITVTNKSEQYLQVIREFLNEQNLDVKEDNITNTVKAFNLFNGEWLLNIVGGKGEKGREKFSVISAIKIAVSYFDHQNIIWVPISLEEILRIAGVSLSKSDGIFTAKNLGVSGEHSDDLLLIGLDITTDDIKIYFYPVEVKIGINEAGTIEKGIRQVHKTVNLFREYVIHQENETFTVKFYRNFFIQMFLSKLKIFENGEFYGNEKYKLKQTIINDLLQDNYITSTTLEEHIGLGAVISFKNKENFRSVVNSEKVTLLNFTEKDGYEGLIQPIEEIYNWIHYKNTDLLKENMLKNTYKPNIGIDEITGIVDEYIGDEFCERNKNEINIKDDKEETIVLQTHEDIETNDTILDTSESSRKIINKLRYELGEIEGSKQKIYWEYGSKALANRHLLISGKSGQGKTYFMQCLLLEASKQGISNIIIDYTEGFLPDQLETVFIEELGDKVTQNIVYNDKFAINPFKKNETNKGGIKILESSTDVAERIKSVFGSVYKSLGIQQLNAIYEATQIGVEKYGNSMDLIKLQELLEEAESTSAKTALSQIRPFIDRNPFDTQSEIDWHKIINNDGEIFIIQLTGYNRDVQLMITEFILWDLWNYSVREGSKDIPISLLLDEAQNLDYRGSSPTVRILTEGRKFGWSLWSATQFLKSQLTADELARLQQSSQKVYFSPPEEEISNIAATISRDVNERKYWERVLAGLKKGQCIAFGPYQGEGGLSEPKAYVVNITSLESRVENNKINLGFKNN